MLNPGSMPLDYGVAPIPKWTAASAYKMMVQPWAVYVNGKSANKAASYQFLKFLTSQENALRLTSITGWVSERGDVNWKPLLERTPQFDVFVAPPKDIQYYRGAHPDRGRSKQKAQYGGRRLAHMLKACLGPVIKIGNGGTGRSMCGCPQRAASPTARLPPNRLGTPDIELAGGKVLAMSTTGH
jgi:Bacterial extracellular solute-binding protein